MALLTLLSLSACLLSCTAGQGCSQMSIPVENKLQLLAEDGDHDDDDSVTTADIYHDLDNNFDKDEDGVVTEVECARHWGCRYGDTHHVAAFMCAVLTKGQDRVNRDDFNVHPYNTSGMPIHVYKNNHRALYHGFQQRHCVNRQVSVYEKLDLTAHAIDFNNDSLLDSEDFVHDLTANYDTDGDGNVTLLEWVVRRICAYGDTAEFARSLWQQETEGRPAIPDDFFTTDAEPQHRGDFKAANREKYETFAAQQREQRGGCSWNSAPGLGGSPPISLAAPLLILLPRLAL